MGTRTQRAGRHPGRGGRYAALPRAGAHRAGGRGGDQRADLYALGATLFELLCGHPPFATGDPLRLVHSHIAEIAPRLVELRPELPAVIDALVARLLAKSPDDRYQSCAGLQADLQRCADALARGAPVASFELGRDDARACLELPSTLYGRERETACVLDCFARAAAGQVELLRVTGPPGVGKSALIADAEPRMAEAGGRMISGKFDQLFVETRTARSSRRSASWSAGCSVSATTRSRRCTTHRPSRSRGAR